MDQVAISQDSLPKDSQSKLVKLPGESCSHCLKCCTSNGKSSDAIQCEICYRWMHALCEGISKEKYRLFSQLASKIPNLVYCSKYIQCYSRLNQMVSVANHDSPVNISKDLKAIIYLLKGNLVIDSERTPSFGKFFQPSRINYCCNNYC